MMTDTPISAGEIVILIFVFTMLGIGIWLLIKFLKWKNQP